MTFRDDYYRTASDLQLRAMVWRILVAWVVVAWGAVIVFIAIPAAKAMVEAHRPAACATLTSAECTALAQDGGW